MGDGVIGAESVLAGRYRLLRVLGRSKRGHLWVAEHLALSAEVAVELLDPALAATEEMRARFRRQAAAAARVRSPHLIQILDHGVDGERPFVAMELLEGEDLGARLGRGRLTPRATAEIVTQIARALTRAHASRLVHGRLRPEAVMLVPNGDTEVVKVLGLGVAIPPERAPASHRGLSPEQVKGLPDIDHRADVWALGSLALECLTSSAEAAEVAAITRHYGAWLARACHVDRSARFSCPRELAEAFAKLAAERVTAPPPAPRLSPPTGARAPRAPARPGKLSGVVVVKKPDYDLAVEFDAARREVQAIDAGWDEPAVASAPQSTRRGADSPPPELDVIFDEDSIADDDFRDRETIIELPVPTRREPSSRAAPRRASALRTVGARMAMFGVALAIFVVRPWLDDRATASPVEAASPSTAPIAVQPASTPISIDAPGFVGPSTAPATEATPPPPRRAPHDDGVWITTPLPDSD